MLDDSNMFILDDENRKRIYTLKRRILVKKRTLQIISARCKKTTIYIITLKS